MRLWIEASALNKISVSSFAALGITGEGNGSSYAMRVKRKFPPDLTDREKRWPSRPSEHKYSQKEKTQRFYNKFITAPIFY